MNMLIFVNTNKASYSILFCFLASRLILEDDGIGVTLVIVFLVVVVVFVFVFIPLHAALLLLLLVMAQRYGDNRAV